MLSTEVGLDPSSVRVPEVCLFTLVYKPKAAAQHRWTHLSSCLENPIVEKCLDLLQLPCQLSLSLRWNISIVVMFFFLFKLKTSAYCWFSTYWLGSQWLKIWWLSAVILGLIDLVWYETNDVVCKLCVLLYLINFSHRHQCHMLLAFSNYHSFLYHDMAVVYFSMCTHNNNTVKWRLIP